MDSPNRLEETCLPPCLQSSFFSRLTDTDISDNDCVHAQKVWRTFDLNTLGDYHDLYMKTYVLLLADIFERFRATCLLWTHYFTAATLKMTGVLLELFTDMHLFVENGIRGRVLLYILWKLKRVYDNSHSAICVILSVLALCVPAPPPARRLPAYPSVRLLVGPRSIVVRILIARRHHRIPLA